jgi:uncharacterized protein YjlB
MRIQPGFVSGRGKDFFLVLKGRLTIMLRDRDVELGEGELFVVPRGMEHCPVADEEAHILLIEPRGTPNTGDSGARRAEREVEHVGSPPRHRGGCRRTSANGVHVCRSGPDVLLLDAGTGARRLITEPRC